MTNRGNQNYKGNPPYAAPNETTHGLLLASLLMCLAIFDSLCRVLYSFESYGLIGFTEMNCLLTSLSNRCRVEADRKVYLDMEMEDVMTFD